MNLCNSCLSIVRLSVKHPQLVKAVKWCDGCRKSRMSYDTEEVIRQILESEACLKIGRVH